MKAIDASNPYQNVSNNERGFRGVLGISSLTVVILGIVSSPVTIFGILIAVYLIMTAIMGTDPIYAAFYAITNVSFKHA